MWTLVEAQKRSNDVLVKGIIETIIKESPILKKLPFDTIQGNSLLYNRELTLPNAQFYAVGDTWTESSGTVEQKSAVLRILGGDTDIDNFVKQTLSDVNNQESDAIEEKSKAIAHQFEASIVYGANSVNPKEFDGLHKLVDATMQVHMGAGAVGAALSMAKLDEMIDSVKPGRPDALIMPRTIRRRISQYYRDGTAGAMFTMKRGEDGVPLAYYGEIPIFVNDFMLMTETIAAGAYSAATGGATGSIFAVKFGSKNLHGIENGGIQKNRLGELETKDAVRWRIKWYVSVVLKNIFSLARIDGITDAAATD